jgi:hypothetical protein
VSEPGEDTRFVVRTDATGTARVPVEPGLALARRMTMTYRGDSTTSAATAEVALPVFIPEARAFPWIVTAVLLVVVAGALVVIVARRRRQEEVVEILTDASGRLAAGDEYRATIFHLFHRLSATATRHGIRMDAAQTARELARAMKKLVPARATAIDRLVAIFERARYDVSPVTAAQRDEALECLRHIRLDIDPRSSGRKTP